MKVKILRNTRTRGKSLEAGKIVDVSEQDAKILITLKKAEVVGKKSVEVDSEDVGSMSKKEIIKALLDEYGIEAPDNANKETLKAMLLEAGEGNPAE